MSDFQIVSYISSGSFSAEQSYEVVRRLIVAISKVHPIFSSWYGGMNAPGESLIRFDERDLYMKRLKAGVDPGYEDEGVSIFVSNRDAAQGVAEAGDSDIWFSPASGFLRIDLCQLEDIFDSTEVVRVCRRLLCSIVEIEPASYAYIDVVKKFDDDRGLQNFKIDYATFPHRRCLGWMAYVPKKLTPQQLPLAADLIDIPGKGTVIVALNEPLDLNNKAHIRRVNEIEMAMVDLDVLPVTDPELM